MADEIEKAQNAELVKEEELIFSPYMDIVEKKDEFEVRADVPGAASDGIEISVENDILRMKVKVSQPETENLPLLYQEYEIGNYETTLRISSRVDVEKIQANLKDGVVTLTLPKREEAKPRQIAVKAA